VRWQTQDADAAQLRGQLRQAARTWDEHHRIDDLLWSGSAYREFAVWRERYPGGLTELEGAFAAAMTSLANRRRRRRRLAVAAGFATLLAVLAVVGTLWRRSVQETRRAEAAKLLALGQLRLSDHPNAALAYAIASLDRADNEGARRFAVEALWQGPSAFSIQDPTQPTFLKWSPDGRWLALSGMGGLAVIEKVERAAQLSSWIVHGWVQCGRPAAGFKVGRCRARSPLSSSGRRAHSGSRSGLARLLDRFRPDLRPP
jgi:hypothetical protein